jgi:hypothetical protein
MNMSVSKMRFFYENTEVYTSWSIVVVVVVRPYRHSLLNVSVICERKRNYTTMAVQWNRAEEKLPPLTQALRVWTSCPGPTDMTTLSTAATGESPAVAVVFER